MSPNIILVGFMGAGKSVVAKNLAVRLKRDVVSTDALIEEREKRPITRIFKESGEPYFRDIEKKIVAEVSQRKDLIIDCGGGVVMNDENIKNLKKNGVLFYLSASADVIYDRVKNDKHRPLLNVADPIATIKGLLTNRQPRYAQAHHTVDTSHKTIPDVVERIIKLYSHE